MKEKITLEQVEQLMDMLTGDALPDGVIMPEQPQLKRRQAFSVVWYLQEVLRVLPDHFSMCAYCGRVFDQFYGYSLTDDGIFCDDQCEANYAEKIQFGGAL